MICSHFLQELLINFKIITESLSSFFLVVTISLISPYRIPFQPAKHACDSHLLFRNRSQDWTFTSSKARRSQREGCSPPRIDAIAPLSFLTPEYIQTPSRACSWSKTQIYYHQQQQNNNKQTKTHQISDIFFSKSFIQCPPGSKEYD